MMQQDGLDDLIADGVNRTEGGHRLLRDQGDLGAANGAQPRAMARQFAQVDGFEAAAVGSTGAAFE